MALQKLEQEWINRIKKGKDPMTDLPLDFKNTDIEFINSKLNKTMFSGKKFKKFIEAE